MTEKKCVTYFAQSQMEKPGKTGIYKKDRRHHF